METKRGGDEELGAFHLGRGKDLVTHWGSVLNNQMMSVQRMTNTKGRERGYVKQMYENSGRWTQKHRHALSLVRQVWGGKWSSVLAGSSKTGTFLPPLSSFLRLAEICYLEQR